MKLVSKIVCLQIVELHLENLYFQFEVVSFFDHMIIDQVKLMILRYMLISLFLDSCEEQVAITFTWMSQSNLIRFYI